MSSGRGTRQRLGPIRRSQSSRAGLLFSVARIMKKMKKCYTLQKRRISKGASVYLTAVIEYLMSEILELAGNNVKLYKRRITTPRHLMLAIMGDAELRGINKTISKPVKKSKPVNLSRTVSFTELTERVFELGRKLCVAKGDITDICVDAIVLPSNSSFSTSGQVGSALVTKGGTPFRNEIQRLKSDLGSLSPLEACRSTAFGIKASNVIFINGPTYSEANSLTKLKDSVLNCIKLSMTESYKTIAFPSIGSGNANFPKQLAAETILQVIRRYLYDQPVGSIEKIYFLLYDRQSVDIYKTELARLM